MKWSIVLAALLAGCASAAGADRVNPHGSAEDCTSCHASATGGAFVGGSDTAACKSCHTEEPHQVGIAPVRARVPESFPLVEGKLACQTCHDEPACDSLKLAADNPRFFRGGPYAHLGDLCSNCHKETALDRFNPHNAMRSTDTDERNAACLYCHDSIPLEGQPLDALRIPGVETCRGCHFETSHAGSREHMAALDPKMTERANEAHLPLTPDGHATCATCHDPHPAGSTASSNTRAGWKERVVIPTAWQKDVLQPAQADRAGASAHPVLFGHDMLRLPLEDGSLCEACHGSGPKKGDKK